MHKKKPNSNLNKNSDLKHKREKSNFKPQIKRSDLKYNLKKIQFSNLNETADFEAQQKKI